MANRPDTVGNCRCSIACALVCVVNLVIQLRVLMAAWVGNVNSWAGLAALVMVEVPSRSMAQFSLNNVHKRGIKHHHFISLQI